MVVRRKLKYLLLVLVAVLLGTGIYAYSASHANAAQGEQVTITKYDDMNDLDWYVSYDFSSGVANGHLVICASGQGTTYPSSGTYTAYRAQDYLNDKRTADILDYLFYHYSTRGENSPLCLTMAVWLLNGHNTPAPQATEAGSQMLAEARAYANRGGGGVEEGCAWIIPSPGAGLQTLYLFMKPSNITINLKKTSAKPSITDNNGCYSLKGAEYGVYKSQSDAVNEQNRVGVLVTNANGVSNSLTNFAPGTYYVKELKAPAGFIKSPQVYSSGNIAGGGTYTFNVSEEPIGDPSVALVQKLGADTSNGEHKDAEGNGTLGGAEFTVKYYDNLDGKTDGTAKKTWIFFTLPNGYVIFDTPNYKGGDSLYLNSAGHAVMPLGTYTVQETKAPEGYLLSDSSVHTAINKANANGTAGSWTMQDGWNHKNADEDFEGRAVVDQVITGRIRIQKLDADLGPHDQGDATLVNTEFTIYNDSKNPVYVNGKEVKNGAPVETLVVGEDGFTQLSSWLPFGNYIVKETKVSEGYTLDTDWQQSVSITEDGKTYTVVKENHIIPTMPNDLIKVDEHIEASAEGDATLEGAEITVWNASTNPIFYEGKEIAVGEEVKKVYTNADGVVPSEELVLPYGTYRFKETAAPQGYLLNEDWEETIIFHEQADITIAPLRETPIPGGARISKVDFDRGLESDLPQGDATLAGAELTIKNISPNPVYVNGEVFESGADITTLSLITDEKGVSSTASTILPYGTYEVRESKAPTGYLDNSDWRGIVTIRENEKVVDADSILVDTVIRGGAKGTKIDTELDGMDADGTQGDATLAGAEISIYNISTLPVFVNGKWVEPASDGDRDSLLAAEPVIVTYTDADGNYSVPSNALPYGTYVAIETAPSQGYLLNEDWAAPFTIREEGAVVDLDAIPVVPNEDGKLREQVIRGDVVLGKVDDETGLYLPLGEGKLSDTVFEITNASADKVIVDGKLFASGEVVKTINTDASGLAMTTDGALPYGTYTYREVKAPYGYLATPGGSGTFHIRENGVLVNGATDSPAPENLNELLEDLSTLNDALPAAARNQVVRGEIYFNKVNLETQEVMSNVAWLITSVETGEKHVIVTDENGMFDSTMTANRSNGNDIILDEKGNVIYDENGLVDTSKLDADNGVWFAGRTDVENPENPDLASFPVGKYILEELPSVENVGLVRVTRSFTISEKVRNNNRLYDLGTINDHPGPRIGTKLATLDGEKNAKAQESLTLVDEVNYENLTIGETYVLTAQLYVFEDGIAKPIEGAIGRTEFKPTTKTGTEKVEITFNATELAGKSTVCFETLYEADTVVAAHNDPADENQTVRFPEIGTTLTGEEGEKVITNAPETVKLVDTVEYKGLKPGETYKLEGELYDKKTEKSLGIKAETEFTPEASDGIAEVVFEVKLSDIKGKTIVAFEKVTKNGREVAIHADIEDEAQTVRVPKIGTTLVDNASNSHKAAYADKLTLVDTIEYAGLTPGSEYTVEGVLMDKTTGKALTVNGKEVTSKGKFTAKESDGAVKLRFEFDGTALTKGATLVAFETVYDVDGNVVAEHKDINDKGQTVEVQPKKIIIKTGDNIVPMFAGAAVIAAASVALIKRMRDQA